MKPERLQTIDRLFESALDLSPESRVRFLDQACAGDSDLRDEVESLLKAHEQAGDFIQDSDADVATALLERDAPRPTQVGQYQIGRLLGAGGMGEVYLATDSRLKRKVALKLLPAWLVSNPEHRQRFEREAQAASALNHPNICTIYEINEHDGTSFIAMEYVDGKTLFARLVGSVANKPRLQSLAETLDIALQLADALAEAHQHGIVHRDIKPANIIVNRRGQVKILDFGLAKKVAIESEAETQQYLSQAGMILGTAAYMSPEQARGLPLDARTDVWSFGVVLYEMLAGEKPFIGTTTADLLAAILRSEPEPLHKLSDEVPGELERIVLKTLRKDRGERYSNAKDLLSDLKELKGNLDFTAGQKRGAARDEKSALSKPEPRNSIAVLPFVNLSAEPENEYFCDGLAEELLNAMAKIDDLKVAARTSSFSFKGKDSQVSEIGKTLGVKTVLEGSVRKSGNRLRITLQLVNAADGYHVWSERYDREMQDIFDLQDEITLAVVEALKVKLFGDEKAAVLKRYTENVEAYQLYLKGRYYWWKTTPEDFHKSRDFFQRAVDADPAYALGYCGLSSYYGFGSAWGMVPPEEGWPRAIAANTKAMELDNTLAEAHNDLAGISMVCYRDSAATQREARRAVELNPRFQEIHYLYSFFLLTRGRFDEAIAEGRQAMELDPLSLRVIQHLGLSYYLARLYDEAITQYRQALELDANNASVHDSLGDALEQKGMYEAAVAEWQLAMELYGNKEGAALLGSSFAKDGFEKAMRTVAQMKLEHLKGQRERGDYIPAIKFARIYTGLGDTEAAFEWLGKACAERNVFPLMIEADPFYDALRSDPRFADLLRRFNLTNDESAAP